MEQIEKRLTPYYRDYLEVFGNAWKPRKVMPGTCEACVFGSGSHELDCSSRSIDAPIFRGRGFLGQQSRERAATCEACSAHHGKHSEGCTAWSDVVLGIRMPPRFRYGGVAGCGGHVSKDEKWPTQLD